MTSKLLLREFDSLKDFLDYAKEDTDMSQGRSSQKRADDAYYKNWYGTASYADAEAIALNWSEGADMVTSFRAVINKNTRVPKKVTLKSVTPPGVINMGAVVTGEPETYYRRENTARLVKGSGKIIRIVVDASAHCGIESKTMERRGAAILALIDALEKSGRRCELTMVWAISNSYGEGRGQKLEYRLLVKRASQRVSLNAMAYSVAHPSMFRRQVFSAMEHEEKSIRDSFGITEHGGYGHPAQSELAAIVKKNGGIYIPNDTFAFESDKRAQDWVKEVAAKQGLVLKDRLGR